MGWTTRWQLPDRHVPGLRAQPWWPELPAAARLEALAGVLAGELEAALAQAGGPGAFERRRADAWIPEPRDGWGMLPVGARQCAVAPRTCQALRELRGGAGEGGGGGLGGAGWYVLRAGARLRAHAGPTNERLTCHLTLGGRGARFTVGGVQREWLPGRALCFDDSFVHEAVHGGEDDRYVLLVDVPHPDLGALGRHAPDSV
ncbi:unnamed protein product [Prorocentrum cordatum]|uniref:Aspartyl/asparaginy/proline hydroxylase domain-containing protein n=1 Tax=Prorocentrum cordatum TaxID=2364126 RepID=A0ABN9SSU6_9DINO|nr:unnamed protein product [Polarella glacialis]